MSRVTAAVAAASTAVLLAGAAVAGSGPSAYAQVVEPLAAASPALGTACPDDMGGMDMGGGGHGMAAPQRTSPRTSPQSPACDARSEFQFLVHMIPHHAEAVAKAKYLAKSKRPEMRAFGRRIVAAQTAEIARMKGWLAEWYPKMSVKAEYVAEMPDLAKLHGDALDKTFLKTMIGHHDMAIAMSRYLLDHKLVEHDEVGPFAANIAKAQTAENKMMRGWLKKWYGITY